MLSFFPPIYKNELIYSVFARYHLRSGNGPKDTLHELFGNGNIRPYPHIPRNLKHLYEQVKHLPIPSLEEWIKENTLYLFIKNFAKDETKIDLINLMLTGESGNSTKNIMIESNDYFRYCSKCIEQDKKLYGETYWRRDHQLFGVFYCLIHNHTLKKSKVLWHPQYKVSRINVFEAAKETNCQDYNGCIPQSSILGQQLLKVTQECNIIANKDLELNFEDISSIYRYLLYKEGYMRGNFINLKKVYKDFKDYYDQKLLDILNATFDESKRSNWISAILKKHNQVFHPVKHILIINFLNESVKNINKYSKVGIKPFGEGPYPCLNPFEEHYGEKVIGAVNIINHKSRKDSVGYFKCHCGFEFTRLVDDSGDPIIFQVRGVGKWKAGFEKLRNKSSQEVREEYGINAQHFLDLKQKYINYMTGQSNIAKPNYEVIKKYRSKWLDCIAENPDLSTDKLRVNWGRIYTFLYRYDKSWLVDNSPNILNVGSKEVDWVSRDSVLLKQVKEAVKLILEKDRPERLSIHNISKAIAQPFAIRQKALMQLPKTREYLDSILESSDDYKIRKIYLAVKKIEESNKDITESSIRNYASLGTSRAIVFSKRVQDVINQILEEQVVKV